MNTETKTVSPTKIALATAIAIALGVYAMAFLPPLLKASQSPSPTPQSKQKMSENNGDGGVIPKYADARQYALNPITVRGVNEVIPPARSVQNLKTKQQQQINLFPAESSDATSGSLIRVINLNAPDRRILSVDSPYGPLRNVVYNGNTNEKFNIAFLAPNGFTDEEVTEIAKTFYARGIQMYSPFREHWSVFNVFVVRVNMPDSDDDTYKEGLARNFPYENIEKIIFLSKMNSSKVNNGTALSYAQMGGDVFMSLKLLNTKGRNGFKKIKNFDFSSWSDGFDFRYWSFEQKAYFTHSLMHELGHAISSLADEYFTENGESKLSSTRVNCKQEAPDFWLQNTGMKDEAYSQNGKILVDVGVFNGCSYSPKNKRGTERSVMSNNISFDYGLLFFPQFGYINRKALEEKFISGKYKEDLSPPCGGTDSGYIEPACGLTTDYKSNGEECLYFHGINKNKLDDGSIANLCTKCPFFTEYGSNGKCNPCGDKNQQICKYHKSSDGTSYICSSKYFNKDGICTACPEGFFHNPGKNICERINCGGENQNACESATFGKNNEYMPFGCLGLLVNKNNLCVSCPSGTVASNNECIACGHQSESACPVDTVGTVNGCYLPTANDESENTCIQCGNYYDFKCPTSVSGTLNGCFYPLVPQKNNDGKIQCVCELGSYYENGNCIKYASVKKAKTKKIDETKKNVEKKSGSKRTGG